MKQLFVPGLIILLFLIGCNRNNSIHELFRWTSTGIPEADSLMIEYERYRVFGAEQGAEKRIESQLAYFANNNPDNNLLHIHYWYVRYNEMSIKRSDEKSRLLKRMTAAVDSSKYPYEWHIVKTLRIEDETDLSKKYDMLIDNIRFFRRVSARQEEARNLILAGNVMFDLEDSQKALEYYNSAASIYSELRLTGPLIISKINIANNSRPVERDSIYRELLSKPDSIKDVSAFALVHQNAFICFDSLPLIEKAIKQYQKHDIASPAFLMALAVQGDYYTRHGNPALAVKILRHAIDTAIYIPNNTHALSILHGFLADAYRHSNNADSCIMALNKSINYRDSLDIELNKPGVYALDAKSRIEMATRNVELENDRLTALWIISLLILIGFIGFLVMRIRYRNAEKRHHEQLMQEKLERKRHSIRAQAMVIDEAERFFDNISSMVNELNDAGKISKESAVSLVRMLRLHKSNEIYRRGFLKVQRELDSSFLKKLKKDYPSLTENQLKIASMIACGVDNRQISNILNIAPASVLKSRYRLRMRLGLTTDESLEDFLRNYNSSEY